ncbi:MAG TPA: AMP-binding protein, partial [Umezawaea sp.]|nr:AMP-binding protein [Umezawaea sp.]
MSHTELIRPVHELLGRHRANSGSKVAFRDFRRAVTYEELHLRTGRLAGHLAGLGVAPGERVVIHLGNRVETIEGYLAVVRASSVAVPLDPQASDAELEHFLRDSGAVLVITDLAHLAQYERLAWPSDRIVVAADDGSVPEGTCSYDDL